MKGKKRGWTLLTLAVVLMALSLAFAVPSGAVLYEAKQRYQDEAPIDWGDDEDVVENDAAGAALAPYRVIATTGESDVTFSFGSDETDAAVLTANALDPDMDTVGKTPVEANFTSAGYSDDTISVTIEEVRQDDSIYHIATVKIASPTQLRTYVAGGLNSARTAATTTLAESVNAIVAVNGDFFEKYTGGYIVRQGQTVRKKVSDNYDLLLIDENADFHLLLAGKTGQKDGIAALLKEHQIVNAFFFGPALVMDGAVCDISTHYGWNPYGNEPRAAIGQLGPLTYAIVTVDGRIDESAGVTLPTLAAFMAQIGCTQAYNLDGGNSSALVYHNELLSIKDVEERSVNDIVYFASATEQGE
jgi:exopolysaccharide biosynthesis protein